MHPTRLAEFVVDHFNWLAVSLFAAIAWWRIQARNKHEYAGQKMLDHAIQSKTAEPLTLHPEIDPKACVGCGTCVGACPEGEILKLVNHKAILVSPTKCVGHGECEVACPMGAIQLVFGTKARGMDIPRITADYETNVPGLYIAGELGGMGLIRNAIRQGHLAAKHALKAKPGSSPGDLDADLLIVGAGPAGISAALTAIALKRSYICIEQGGFGGTVYQFPRQKVVMTQPAELPGIGQMKFPGHKVSKEELLAYWNDVRVRTGLKITENTKFEALKKDGDVFNVKTSKREYRVRKVILAMGVRGTPRKLGLANEALPKVTYNLIEPEQYQGQRCAVVGGGNAGVEAAQYLARPSLGNEVLLLVRGETFDRCNDENLRIIQGLEKEGRVRILMNTVVKTIEKDRLILSSGSAENRQDHEVPNDFLFIFAGAEMPHKFLMSLGIRIEKKFGEALRRAI